MFVAEKILRVLVKENNNLNKLLCIVMKYSNLRYLHFNLKTPRHSVRGIFNSSVNNTKINFKIILPLMKFSLYFIVLLAIFSCTTKGIKSNHVISIDIIDNKEKHLPKISIESIVPLETNELTLFGYIETIQYEFGKIYLLDPDSSKSVMVFSKDGKFINKTKLGKGPEELINPFAFSVDQKNEHIYVWDQTLSSLFKFDLELNFIDKKKYDMHLMDFSILGEGEALVRSHYEKDFSYSSFSLKKNSTIEKFIPDYNYSGGVVLFGSISTKKRTLFITPLEYNVYEFLGDQVHSEYFFDFGKYKFTQDEVENNEYVKNRKLIYTGKRVSSLYGISESDDFILFHVYYRNEAVFYAYSDKTNETYRLNDYFEKGLLPKCKVRGTVEKNTFFAIVEPIDMIEFQKNSNQKLVEGKIDTQQNPFIITFSISELE